MLEHIKQNTLPTIGRFLKKYWYLVLLLTILVSLQLSTRFFWDTMIDAHDYIDYAYSYNVSFKRVFNDYRAPVFPFILYILGYTELSSNYLRLFITHIGMLLVTLELAKRLADRIFNTKVFKNLYIINLVFAFELLWFSKTLLSEITTVFFLYLALFCFSLLIESTKIKYTAATVVFLLLTIFTRPFNLYLLFPWLLTLILLALKQKKFRKKYLLNAFLIFSLVSSVALVYSRINLFRYKYNGISIEGGANLFARVAKNPEWLPETDEEFPEILQRAKTCAPDKIDYFTCQWPLVPAVNPLPEYRGSLGWERDDSYIQKVEEFSKKYIIYNFGKYSKESLINIYSSMTEVYKHQGMLDTISSKEIKLVFEVVYKYAQIAHLAFLPSLVFVFVLSLFDYIKNNNKERNNVLIVCLGTTIYYLLVTGYVAAGDFWRMITPILPILYLFLFYTCETLYVVIKKGREK